MELVLIGVAALLISALTLFSGFGLGTVLMPVFALFFPVPLAIAATAVVHFANNIFKFGLMAKQADWRVVARFSVPAAIAAMIGAGLLNLFDQMPVVASYTLGGSTFEITVIKAVIGTLIVVFALLEMSPRFQTLAFPPSWLPLGGALSGFFGGLSGNQGALRSAFLLKSGLSKEAFVATGVVSAVIVDAARLVVCAAKRVLACPEPGLHRQRTIAPDRMAADARRCDLHRVRGCAVGDCDSQWLFLASRKVSG